MTESIFQLFYLTQIQINASYQFSCELAYEFLNKKNQPPDYKSA